MTNPLNPRHGGSEGGGPPSWGAREGAGPFSGSREASLRADPATERGSNPVARSMTNPFWGGVTRSSLFGNRKGLDLSAAPGSRGSVPAIQ